MAAGDVADGEGHGQDRQSEGESHAGKADAEARNAAASTALPQPPKTSQKVPSNSAAQRLVRDIFAFFPPAFWAHPHFVKPGPFQSGMASIEM